jgi:hypothetical protein
MEQTNNVVLWDSTNAKMRTIDSSSDTLRWNVNTTIGGDLTVTGTTTTVHSETVLIQDNFLDLNYGYNTATAEAGGLTVNYLPTSVTDTASAFIAGAASTGPRMTVASTSGFAANDIVQVSGSTDKTNDGLYILSAASGTTLTCQGISGTSVAEAFARNQFTASSGESATVTKVTLSVMKCNTSGVWQIGSGAVSPLSYADVQTGSDAAESLQNAYEAGATITTASSTDMALTLSSGNFTAGGNGAVLLTPTSASSFTSGGALTFTAGAASTWSTSSGALTIDSAGALTMDTDGTDAINLGTEAAAKTISIGADASTMVDINALDIQLDAGSGGYDIDGAGNSTLSTSGTGTLTIDSAGALTIDTDGTDAINIGTEAVAKVITIGSSTTSHSYLNANVAKVVGNAAATFGDAVGQITMASGQVYDTDVVLYDLRPSSYCDITAGAASTLQTSSGALTLTSAAAATWSTGAGALTLYGAGGANIVSTGGQCNINASGQTLDMDATTLDLDSSGATDILAASTMSVKGATGASFGDDTGTWEFNGGGAVTETGMTSLSVTPSGAITLTAGAASTWSTSAGALTLDGASGVLIDGNASEVDITTTGTLDANVGLLDIDSSGNVDIDGTISTFKGSTAVVVGQGSSVVQIATGALTDTSMVSYSFGPSAAFDVDAGAASTIQTSAGGLALVGAAGISSVSTGGTYLLNAAGQTVDVNCTTLDIDCTGGFQLDGAAASNIQTTGADTNINTVTSGHIVLDSAERIKLEPAAAAFTELNGFTSICGSAYNQGQIGVYAPALNAISAGEMVYVTNGGYTPADASAIATSYLSGCAFEAIGSGASGRISSLSGSFIKPIFDAATAASGADVGKRCFLSETAGKVSLTAPTNADSVVYQVGYLVATDETTTGNHVAFFPQFIIENQ